MKKLFLLLFVFCASIMILQAQNGKARLYFIKSGYVKMNITGNSKGTKELWWDDYGHKSYELEKSTTTTKVFGIKNTEERHDLTIIKGGKVWKIDFLKKEGTISNIPEYKGKPITEMSEKEQKELADKTLNSLGGSRIGTKQVMGYTCEGISLMGSKAWSYKNVTLLLESNIMGIEITQTAEVFKPNIKVAASKFVAPADIKYKDVSSSQPTDLYGAMNQAINQAAQEESEQIDEAENNDQLIPTKYPYDKFIEKIDAFNYDNYTKIMAESREGSHNALFVKGLTSTIMLTVVSKKNGNLVKEEGFTKFKQNGKTYMYKSETDQDGKKISELAVENSTYDSYIIMITMPAKSKEDMLVIYDKLGL